MAATVRKLILEDIADQRAYERDRTEFRRFVMDLKRRRRVALGAIMSVVFENAVTVRYQVQEMARVEHLGTDAQIQAELDVYNPLIPQPGELSATVFIELTDEAALRQWLPKLVGIERALVLRIGGHEPGPGVDEVRGEPEAAHAEQLTREEITASVHYVRFALAPAQVERFATGPVFLASVHPAYDEHQELGPETVAELLGDLRP